MTYNYARKENEGIFWPAESYLRAYIVEVSSPRVIKLNDPAPFAYLINIVPQLDPANTVINDGPSKIRLNSVNLSLQNRVHFCATSGSGPQISDHYFVQHFELGKVFQSSVDFPILSNNSEYHEVNIGNSFQLSCSLRPICSGRLHRISPEIYHDFVTYNVKLTNSLQWGLSVTVAEKTSVLQDCTALSVLAPS
jgi:hypothetical protein